jgi:hypothetical protein
MSFTIGNIKYADGTIHKNVLITNLNLFDATKIKKLSKECQRNRKSSNIQLTNLKGSIFQYPVAIKNDWDCEDCMVKNDCWCHKKTRMLTFNGFDKEIVRWRQDI